MAPDSLSQTFAALADLTRRAILKRLARGATSATKLAQPFAMSLPAICKHLDVLERVGLVERGRNAQRRPCRLEALPLKQAVTWLERYRGFWEDRFDRRDKHLCELPRPEKIEI